MKLEPTEAQLELIAKAAGMAVWEMQIAFDIANSVPEGAPVDTIARRPDGMWIAMRYTRHGGEIAWAYQSFGNLAAYKQRVPEGDDADSWPVIYDPREQVAVNSDAGLEFFPPGEEPLVPRPESTAQQEPAEASMQALKYSMWPWGAAYDGHPHAESIRAELSRIGVQQESDWPVQS